MSQIWPRCFPNEAQKKPHEMKKLTCFDWIRHHLYPLVRLRDSCEKWMIYDSHWFKFIESKIKWRYYLQSIKCLQKIFKLSWDPSHFFNYHISIIIFAVSSKKNFSKVFKLTQTRLAFIFYKFLQRRTIIWYAWVIWSQSEI